MDNYPDTFAFVQIHAGSDGYDTVWGNARKSFYGVSGYPTTTFDGVLRHAGAHTYSLYHNEFLSRAPVSSDVTIELTGDEVSEQTYSVQANVCVESGGEERTMRIYMVQVLDYWPLPSDSPPGNSYSRNGFKQAADTHGSEPDITLADGQCETIEREFTFDARSWDYQDDIKIVVWAQVPGSSWPKEAYQAAVMAWPFPPSDAVFIELPDGGPEYISPDEPTDITVQIEDGSETYVPGSGTLHYRYDGGDYLTDALTSLGGGLYRATLPPADCSATPEYYFSAEGDEGTTSYDPRDAPTDVHTAGVAVVTTAIDDDFETDQGWTVEDDPSLTDGSWDRGVPVEETDPDRQPPDADYDGSGQCYLTDNVAGNSDVDGGPTMLISPTMDMGGMSDPVLSYSRWWYNDDLDDDPFDVEISNDDGQTWFLIERVTNTLGGWVAREVHVTDYVALTAEMKIRFSAADFGASSIDEGGVDAIRIRDVVCNQADCDFDGDGDVDLDDYVFFPDCMAGPDTPPDPSSTTEAQCLEAFDFDADNDVDLENFAAFQRASAVQ